MGKGGKKAGKLWAKQYTVPAKGIGKLFGGGGPEKLPAVSSTQKKILKQSAREFHQGSPLRQQGQDIFQQQSLGNDPISQQFNQQFGVGGQAYNPENYADAFKNAQLAFEPQRQEQQRLLQQQTLPDIMNLFGRGGKTSSALNQALGSAVTNLHSNFNSQVSQLASQNVNNQNQMQYNALNQQFANRQQAANQLQGAGMQQGAQTLGKDPFLYSQQGPSGGQQAVETAIKLAPLLL